MARCRPGDDAGDSHQSLWFPHYLPQWSSRAASAARYELTSNGLTLLIEEEQPPWCPEFDGPTRVSSLQTGVRSGPRGSEVGQHRFAPGMVVREEQEERLLLAPKFGVIAVRCAALDDPACMVALWMIGIEDRLEHSAEICVCEIFGSEVEPGRALVGMGVHPFGDPGIRDDFEKVRVDADVRELHEYSAEWRSDGVTFFFDGEPVKAVGKSPTYAMQCMLGIYEFGGQRPGDSYPKRFEVEWFRFYRPASPPG